MARGSEQKEIIIQKILETFAGSFLYNGGKEIRIPIDDIQIKVALTCAKENVVPEDETRLPGEAAPAFPDPLVKEEEIKTEEVSTPEVKASAEEIALVNQLMKDLNL